MGREDSEHGSWKGEGTHCALEEKQANLVGTDDLESP